MKIAIIGAGFYGSYLAYKFSNIKSVKVDLFEKNKRILSETAIKNQYRLHTGYHYPRSIATILQTSEGYTLFKKEFIKPYLNVIFLKIDEYPLFLYMILSLFIILLINEKG